MKISNKSRLHKLSMKVNIQSPFNARLTQSVKTDDCVWDKYCHITSPTKNKKTLIRTIQEVQQFLDEVSLHFSKLKRRNCICATFVEVLLCTASFLRKAKSRPFEVLKKRETFTLFISRLGEYDAITPNDLKQLKELILYYLWFKGS